jgi:hypothetical protein
MPPSSDPTTDDDLMMLAQDAVATGQPIETEDGAVTTLNGAYGRHL